jgi:membrane fusion protein (multidrug efflux system)
MDEPTTPVVRNRASPAKLIKMGIAAVILLVALGFGVHYWRLSQLYVSTDNAYLNADRIEMAAQVSGPVIRIWVQDQQAVRRGDLLLEIDPQPYQLAVDAAEAQLELSYQSSSQDRAAVAAARAMVEQRTAELHNAQSTEQRAMELTKQS